MEWFALLIPLLVAGFLLIRFGKRLTWWELLLPVAVGAVIIGVGKSCAQWAQSQDTEYWGGYVTRSTYYEHWDEEVPCRHPKYKEVACGTKSNPSATCEEQDGYEHPYDVDDHPEHWVAEDTNGENWDIDDGEWQRLVNQFGNRTFRDMHRNYHLINGNAYDTKFNGEYERLEPTVKTHSYENRVAASDTVLNYPEVTPEDAAANHLFGYVQPSGYHCPSVLSPMGLPGAVDLDKLNALYGGKRQVRVWLLVFQNAPATAGPLQEAFWKRGNKNELTICVSVDPQGVIQWQHVFCWCDDQSIKVDTESYLVTGKRLDITALAQWLGPEIDAKWKRKHFKEFSYITVDPSPSAMTILYILVVCTTGGICYWSVTNEYQADGTTVSDRPYMRRRF